MGMTTDLTGTDSFGHVIAFPLASRTSNIRRCAAELDSRHGDEALHYWRNECRSLADHLLALGYCDTDMRKEVRNFQDEVQAELARRYVEQHSAEAGNR